MSAQITGLGDILQPDYVNIPNVQIVAGNAMAASVVAADVTSMGSPANIVPSATTPLLSSIIGTPTASADSDLNGLGLSPDCMPTLLPTLQDLSTMHGKVCQFTFPSNLLSIERCCTPGALPQSQGNCTQYCEVPADKMQFQNCIKSLIHTLPVQERPKNWKIKCQNAEKNTVTGGKNKGEIGGESHVPRTEQSDYVGLTPCR